MRLLVSPEISLAALLLLMVPASAQTYDLGGSIEGLAGEDYEVTGTVTFSNNAWTINGKLTSTTKPQPPSQCQTINAPNGSLTDATGAVWTWGRVTNTGQNWNVLRNGDATTMAGDPPGHTLAAVAMTLNNGIMFNRHFNGSWRRWTPQGWVAESGTPAGC